MIIMLTERGSRVIERQTHTYHTSMDGRGRDFRARFTFRSTVPSSSRPSGVRVRVRSIPETPDGRRTTTTTGGEGRKEGRKGRSFVPSFVALPTCGGNLPLSLPPSLRSSVPLPLSTLASVAFSLPLSLSVSCLVLGQNVRVYSQVGMAASLARRVGRYAL